MIKDEMKQLIRNTSPDQNAKSKTSFLRTAKEGQPTRLKAFGLSNGKVKKLAVQFYSEEYKSHPFDEVLFACDLLFREAEFVEDHMLIFYLLERFHKQFTSDLFSVVNQWIDLIDHWISSDHIDINVMRKYPIERHLKEISSWRNSENFWRRRQSITILLKHLKKDNVGEILMGNIEHLKTDKSYYVRKGFTWVMREYSKIRPEIVYRFLDTNINHLNKTELRECSKYLKQKEELIEKYERIKRL